MNNNRLLQPFVLDMARGQKQNCQVCGIKFQLLVKIQHQCKKCYRSICYEKCGLNKQTIYFSDGSQSVHKICTICWKQSTYLRTFMDNYKLCFGQDSQFVQEWLKKLNKQHQNYENILDEYSDNMTLTSQNTIKFKRQANTYFQQLLQSYNYSFRHFIRSLLTDVKENMFRTKVMNVMVAIYVKLTKLPYIQQLIYLVIFFLCFASQAHTYFIITRLIEKIYPQYLRVKKMKKDNLLGNQLRVLLELYSVVSPDADKNQIERVTQYLQDRFSNYIVGFTLNICGINNTIFLIDEMLRSGSYLTLYKGIVTLIFNNKEDFMESLSAKQIQMNILKKVTIQMFKSTIIQFQKVELNIELSHEVFQSAQHRKLYQKFKNLQNLYKKSEQILLIKDNKIKTISKQLSDKKKQVDQLNEQKMRLTEELLMYSDKVANLAKNTQLEKENENLKRQTKFYKDKFQQYKSLYEKIDKQKDQQTNKYKMWQKMQKDYLEEIVALKSQNQIYSIQISAENINFNTDTIDKKIQDKNAKIHHLQQKLKELQYENQYYKKNGYQPMGKAYINPTANVKQPAEQSVFSLQIEASKNLIKQLQKDNEQLKKSNEQVKNQLGQLNVKHHILQKNLKRYEFICSFLDGIKQSYDYQEGITTLEKLINKEDSHTKKVAMVKIKQLFIQCQMELKYKLLDMKLKDRRKLRKESQELNNIDLDNIQSILQSTILNQQITEQEKQQCQIM